MVFCQRRLRRPLSGDALLLLAARQLRTNSRRRVSSRRRHRRGRVSWRSRSRRRERRLRSGVHTHVIRLGLAHRRTNLGRPRPDNLSPETSGLDEPNVIVYFVKIVAPFKLCTLKYVRINLPEHICSRHLCCQGGLDIKIRKRIAPHAKNFHGT